MMAKARIPAEVGIGEFVLWSYFMTQRANRSLVSESVTKEGGSQNMVEVPQNIFFLPTIINYPLIILSFNVMQAEHMKVSLNKSQICWSGNCFITGCLN
jgi:hypothetical protein